jgi:hypothetical protein
MSKRTACLENQWALVPAPGKIALSDQVPGAKQIADGNYDPATRQLSLTFQDGTAEEVGL